MPTADGLTSAVRCMKTIAVRSKVVIVQVLGVQWRCKTGDTVVTSDVYLLWDRHSLTGGCRRHYKLPRTLWMMRWMSHHELCTERCNIRECDDCQRGAARDAGSNFCRCTGGWWGQTGNKLCGVVHTQVFCTSRAGLVRDKHVTRCVTRPSRMSLTDGGGCHNTGVDCLWMSRVRGT